jgi:hypothetical protein
MEVAESTELVAGIPDARIEEELIRTARQRSSVLFVTLGEPGDRPSTIARRDERRPRPDF